MAATGLMWKDGDLVVEDGTLVINYNSVLQDLKLRIYTLIGTHYLNKSYGSDLMLRIGEPNTHILQNTIIDDLEYVLQQDPRVLAEEVSVVFQDSDSIVCNVYYQQQSTSVQL